MLTFLIHYVISALSSYPIEIVWTHSRPSPLKYNIIEYEKSSPRYIIQHPNHKANTFCYFNCLKTDSEKIKTRGN